MGHVLGLLFGTPLEDDTGATAVEYAIIASLIAAVIILVVTALGLKVSDLFGSIPAF